MNIIATLNGEGFNCDLIKVDNFHIRFKADLDIDADGANGQYGMRAAYMEGDKGSELLANGGLHWNGERVVPTAAWFQDIVILEHGKKVPRVFPGGIIASKTSYHYEGIALDNPLAYVDSETVPYICIPPQIINCTPEIVMGCACEVINLQNGKRVLGMVADVGPRRKCGEASIKMARELGVNESPRYGGEDEPMFEYHVYAGIQAKINGSKIRLLASNGTYHGI